MKKIILDFMFFRHKKSFNLKLVSVLVWGYLLTFIFNIFLWIFYLTTLLWI